MWPTLAHGVRKAPERRRAECLFGPFLLVGVLLLLAVELFLAFRTGVSLYPIVARGVALAALVLALVNPDFQNHPTPWTSCWGSTFRAASDKKVEKKRARFSSGQAAYKNRRRARGF